MLHCYKGYQYIKDHKYSNLSWKNVSFVCKIKKLIHLKGKVKRKRWINTNKLLGEEGFYGIKTGITPVAGPCLASWYKKDEKNIIIILLNCDSVNSRWNETKELAAWVNV